jgi:hypothetical protein
MYFSIDWGEGDEFELSFTIAFFKEELFLAVFC